MAEVLATTGVASLFVFLIGLAYRVAKIVAEDKDGVKSQLERWGLPEWAAEGLAVILIGAYKSLAEHRGQATQFKAALTEYRAKVRAKVAALAKTQAKTQSDGDDWEDVVMFVLNAIALMVQGDVNGLAQEFMEIGVNATLATLLAYAFVYGFRWIEETYGPKSKGMKARRG